MEEYTNKNFVEDTKIWNNIVSKRDKDYSDIDEKNKDLKTLQRIMKTWKENNRITEPHYEIIDIDKFSKEEKIEHLNKHRLFKEEFEMNTKVNCVHCGETYEAHKFILIGDVESGSNYIMCKNYPECDGSLVDLKEIK